MKYSIFIVIPRVNMLSVAFVIVILSAIRTSVAFFYILGVDTPSVYETNKKGGDEREFCKILHPKVIIKTAEFHNILLSPLKMIAKTMHHLCFSCCLPLNSVE